SGDARLGKTAVARDEFAQLARVESAVEPNAGDAVMRPANATAEFEVAQLDRDRLADRIVATAEVADPAALARQLDEQAPRGLASGLAEPDRMAHGVALV